jgi:hypothetical protein
MHGMLYVLIGVFKYEKPLGNPNKSASFFFPILSKISAPPAELDSSR